MHRVGWFRLPGIPYLGTFPETNVRLYSVDAHGRRGVVFRSLDASRLIPVIGRADRASGMPYVWSRMAIQHDGDTVTYTSTRRWPGPRGARSRITVRIGERIEEPTELEHFLTARWGMHNTFFGRPVYLPNDPSALAAAPRRTHRVRRGPGGGGRTARTGRRAGERAVLAGRPRTFRAPRPPGGIPAP